MRKIFCFLTASILLSCAQESSESGELTAYLPVNSAVILKLQDPDLFFSNLHNNEFVRNNSSHPLFRSLQEGVAALDNFSHDEPALLSFSGYSADSLFFTYISKGIPEEKSLDSIRNKQVETFKTSSGEFRKYVLEGRTTYTTSIDSIFILSNSRKIIESRLSGTKNTELLNSPDFEKALRASSGSSPVMFIDHDRLSRDIKSFFPVSPGNSGTFSKWTALDLDINQSFLKFNGITTAADSLPRFINLFRNVGPARNELAQITPANSRGFQSFAFQNFSVLRENLQVFHQRQATPTSAETELLEAATEAGIIYLQEAEVFAVRPLIPENQESFLTEDRLEEEFRGIRVFRYSSPEGFKDLLSPLPAAGGLRFVASLGNFLVFSQEVEALRDVISGFSNERTLSTNEAYLAALQSLSSEASLLKITTTGSTPEGDTVSEGTFSFKEHPVAAFQVIYNGDFAHVHGVIEKNEPSSESGEVQQAISVSLDSEVAIPPSFFKNHRTKGMDIAVQDVENNLYLISAEGNIFWKKKLDARILGRVQQVDILRNGRYQLAFATPNALHVLDRNGNIVKPFPLQFKDEITQPVAIFDYENNRNYRFVIVQHEEVFMYDNRGRSVSGFKFRKASERITQQPKHIRIGNKDYLLIPETSGRLNILSRTGDIRVPVKEDIAFSDNEWYEYENRFITTNELGQLVKIDQNGKVIREDLNLTDNHKIDATPKTLVTLSENELSIKGKKITLDFGLYTRPQIFYLNNKVYVGLTDTQASRVFLFDSNGELLPGFPVYGTSLMDLGNAYNDSKPELVVQGSDNTLLLYEL